MYSQLKNNLLIVILSLVAFGLKSQDTITIQTLTWDSTGRSYWYNFPDIPADQIARINMIYNMRCHNAAVGNGNIGCYEWDYSCNTFITDTFRTDSIQALHKKYIMPGIKENEYYYSNQPSSNCFSVKQRIANYTGISNEIINTVGSSTGSLKLGPNAGKLYLLYRADELKSQNITSGKISGIQFKVKGEGGTIPFLKLRLQNSSADQLLGNTLDPSNMSEHYFSNTTFGKDQRHKLIFHTAFNWDGKSSILIEMSFNILASSNPIELDATDINQTSLGAINGSVSLYKYGSKGFPLMKDKLSTIQEEVTVSLWTKGDSNVLPVNTTIFEAVDIKNQRQMNVHLPWGNGSMYWDCGNEGNGYDRIEKAANIKEIEGQWIHWAFTKNSRTGVMNIFKNGKLWHSGSGKTKKIQIDMMTMLSSIENSLSYFGRVCQFSVWDKELDSISIRDWMYSAGAKNHKFYSALKYYFPLNDKVQGSLKDESENPSSIQTQLPLTWVVDQGRNAINEIKDIGQRPVTGFIQGIVNGLNIGEENVNEDIPNPPITIEEYEIVKGSASIKKLHIVYPAGDFIIFNEEGEFIDIKSVPHDGIFVNEDLRYQRYAPGKFELLSLVTPYGNGLDLGKEGKTFVFDVTDYAPILRGNKRLSIELGGENQEELDIKFQYIKGKPAREVKDIQNVYMFQRQWFPDILSNTVFEPRKIKLNKDSRFFRLRTTVTGHEQNGEFVNRSHFIKVDGSKGSKKFDFNVWKECANNPIYPQGGTWIFDRAGWCPGAASDTYFHDISDLAVADSEATIDYGLNGGNLAQANYLVSCQLVSYGDLNYGIDAGIENVIRPNSSRVEFDRFNPSCSRPAIQIKNFGKTEITSILIQYGMQGGIELQHLWKGNLLSLNTTTIDLPIPDAKIWENAQASDNTFLVRITKVNETNDENERNNSMSTKFNFVKSFDFDPVFEIRTNSVAGDNSFKIKDMNGNVLLEKRNINANTTIQENLAFGNGCYTIEVDDKANDGLSFWFYPNLGSGSSAIKRRQNTTLVPVHTFRSDFGAGYQFDFVINKVNSVESANSGIAWSLSPIPANDYILLELQGLQDDDIILQLISMDGKILDKRRIASQEGKIKEKIQLAQMQPGIYSIQLIMKNRVLSRKIIID